MEKAETPGLLGQGMEVVGLGTGCGLDGKVGVGNGVEGLGKDSGS